MQKKASLSMMVAALALVSVLQANAQGFDPELRNLQRNINIDLTNGAISQAQAVDLHNRIAQIKAENAQYLTMNGGVLTPGQAAHINAEIADLNGYKHWDHAHGALWGGQRSPEWYRRHHQVAPAVPVGAGHGDWHHGAGATPGVAAPGGARGDFHHGAAVNPGVAAPGGTRGDFHHGAAANPAARQEVKAAQRQERHHD